MFQKPLDDLIFIFLIPYYYRQTVNTFVYIFPVVNSTIFFIISDLIPIRTDQKILPTFCMIAPFRKLAY